MQDVRKIDLMNFEKLRYDLRDVYFFDDKRDKKEIVTTKLPEGSLIIGRPKTVNEDEDSNASSYDDIFTDCQKRRFIYIEFAENSDYESLKKIVYEKTGRTEVKSKVSDQKSDESKANIATEETQKNETKEQTVENQYPEKLIEEKTKCVSDKLAERKKAFFDSKRVSKQNF